MSVDEVWVLTITHKNGGNTYVFSDEYHARQELYAWVEKYWNEVERLLGEIPTDKQEAIDDYFETHGIEFYNLSCEPIR